MKRMIPIVDLTTGRVSERPSDTPTIDLPSDFDRQTARVALDASAQAHYASTHGTSVHVAVQFRPLSWRVRGEHCLVAVGSRAATPSRPSSYKLCAVDPNR